MTDTLPLMYEVLRCASTTDTQAKYSEHLVISIGVLGLIRANLHLNERESESEIFHWYLLLVNIDSK